VLTVGSAVSRVVGQLSAAAPADLVALTGAASTYPPPLIRLALFGELAGLLEIEADAPSASAVEAMLDLPAYAALPVVALEEHRAHLRVLPQVADALLTLEAHGSPVAQLSGFDPGLLGVGGRADTWAGQLFEDAPALTPLKENWSARTLVAAGARHATYPLRAGDTRTDVDARLRSCLLTVLPDTGTGGQLAAEDEAPPHDPAVIADALAAALLEEVS
jgi:hypothetical protein